MPDDELMEIVDKDALIDFLMESQLGAQAHAFGAKDHVAIKAYAQAAAFQYVANKIMSGEFDLIPMGSTLQ